ncbi:MAG: 2-oxoglutarate dehydrogenase E1 component [Rhizobiales bacterium]|nr:2-oxoglutarate dehydrogenase E1 component [Hyphomicrobiales bacterium]
MDDNAAIDLSAFSGANAAYLESLTGEETAGPSWKKKGWPVQANGELISALDGNWAAVEKVVTDKLKSKAQEAVASKGAPATSDADLIRAARDSVHALMMIRAYRMRGHLHANLDPLGLEPRKDHEELHPSSYGFVEADWDRKIFIDNVLGLEFATIREMLAILRRTYCETIGYEFMHISDPAAKSWLQARIEGPDKEITFTREGKRAILNKLVEAEGFEKFLDVKFTGTKRFGLDGGESLIPALEQIIKRGGNLGVKDIVFGMAHRGRLNVLTQVMGKPHRALFHEFKGGSFAPDDVEGSGDVKYHLGASSDRTFDGSTVHLSLTPNPSHLEIVNPVVLGKVRAKQDQHGCPPDDRTPVMPLLIHGDAAFAGQGVVAECFGLSGLKGHRTGGSVHFIINNQIGFTTYPRYSRSSPYPSDVAKMVEAPIFHVNGDDPEAVVFAAKVATEFRMKFQRPVVIDMWCYRRFGHNEGDEPAFTQPLMYKNIRAHVSTLEMYAKRLIETGVVTEGEVDKMKADWRSRLEAEFEAGQAYKPNKADWLDGKWAGLTSAKANEDDPRRGQTGLDLDRLKEIGLAITRVPEGFNIHKTIQRFLDNRRKMIETGSGLDWATAESLAFGSLVSEGHRVRLSGQDCERGTFSQRHSVLIDQETEARYTPLNNVQAGQAKYEVINSMLSEEAVLGFEYGYSLSEPNALTCWEAQFGDFANGAQVLFDQFIGSGERKWLRMSGLVCLLPHGYEGQGPEHSSARLERFLQLCAEDNMQVANCTTPANYFHILRRQLKRDFRKPLILMTPKSLLRHKRCVSDLSEFAADSSFHRILKDDAEAGRSTTKLKADAKIRRVILCSGKVYYDLLDEREKRGIDDVYLLRVEQLYPFPMKSVATELSRFKKADIVWCQEEPKNMGSWTFVEPYLEWALQQVGASTSRARYAGRPAAASTAVGQMSKHLEQLNAFMNDAFAA